MAFFNLLNAQKSFLRISRWQVPPTPSRSTCVSLALVFTTPFYCQNCNSPLCNKNCKISAEHQQDCVLLRKIKHLADQDGETILLSLLLLSLRCLMLRVEQPEKWKLLTSLVDHVVERKRHSDLEYHRKESLTLFENLKSASLIASNFKIEIDSSINYVN